MELQYPWNCDIFWGAVSIVLWCFCEMGYLWGRDIFLVGVICLVAA
ncbi:hypothetical protein QA584_03165 [Anaerocolumna sp. AGMB13025]|nr:hypothetical protein [Anaerocolumna sp. AGMB13025]WFR58078.1 hypothetical protein QA584_03165 [Anaerocolumna sp. AGMB13025]